MIVKHSGADPGLIKYVYFGSAIINEFDTQSGTIFGHANAVGAEAVGAARYSNTPAFSVFPPILESFSSSGATPILFDLAGNRLPTPDAAPVQARDCSFGWRRYDILRLRYRWNRLSEFLWDLCRGASCGRCRCVAIAGQANLKHHEAFTRLSEIPRLIWVRRVSITIVDLASFRPMQRCLLC